MGYVGWRYYPNPWRKFCDRWWIHWFKLDRLWWDIRDIFQRGMRGYANGDTFDMLSYHAGVTVGMLKRFRAHHLGYIGESPEEYNANLDLAIDAWEAKLALVTDDGWIESGLEWEDWSKPLEERWERGYPVFIEIYDSLWE